MKSMPPWLLSKLRTPPEAGAGVHAWLYSTARHLHAHMSPAEAIMRLKAATAFTNRRVPDREIADAVHNSMETAWRPHEIEQEGPPVSASPVLPPVTVTERWPAKCPVTRACGLLEARNVIGGLVDLWERSPVRPDGIDADQFLDTLFPGDPWVCCAEAQPQQAETKRRSQWEFLAPDMAFVVPSAMSKPLGARKDGRPSTRCLANTGPRQHLVVEFDDDAGQDIHAGLLWHLDRVSSQTGGPRLKLAVHSGGKSLHGWFLVAGHTEDALRSWFSYAVRIGADPATFTRCQLVRMPAGRRADGARQSVFYFDP